MKLKLKSGGIIKLQNAATTIPNNDWDNFPRQLNLTSFTIPASKSITDQSKWKGKLESLWRNIKLRLESTVRPKAISVFSSAYGKPTTIVKDGGNLT